MQRKPPESGRHRDRKCVCGGGRIRCLLGKFGLSVCLAFLLVFGHLLRHRPANGFLELVKRFFQPTALPKAQQKNNSHAQPRTSRWTEPGGRASVSHCPFSQVPNNEKLQPWLLPPLLASTYSFLCLQRLPLAGLSHNPHLLVEVEPAGPFDQGVFAAGEEGGQVSVHPGPDLAVQFLGLQLDAGK